MILTITLNPSIDRRYDVNEFEKGKIFRTSDYQYTPGGKGLNVSKVIKSFKAPVVATGFLGGSGGDFISKGLGEMDIKHDFVAINGETRSCLAIISNDGSQTEILERGPSISAKEIQEFNKLYEDLLDDTEIICASGSLPEGIATDIYKDMISLAKKKNKKFILDTSGEALKLGIEAGPYMVKPNQEELEKLTGITIKSEEDLINSGRQLLEKGIEVVVISLGAEGSMVFHKNDIYRVTVPSIETVSPVGSGDSMVAGLAVGLHRNYDFETTLKLGAACGTANAMESETGKVDQENVNSLIKKIRVEKQENKL